MRPERPSLQTDQRSWFSLESELSLHLAIRQPKGLTYVVTIQKCPLRNRLEMSSKMHVLGRRASGRTFDDEQEGTGTPQDYCQSEAAS